MYNIEKEKQTIQMQGHRTNRMANVDGIPQFGLGNSKRIYIAINCEQTEKRDSSTLELYYYVREIP